MYYENFVTANQCELNVKNENYLEGVVCKTEHVLKLKKSLYGIK